MSVEERLQQTRLVADWVPMNPLDSRKIEALARIADAEAAIAAAERALDAATAAINRSPAATESVDGGDHLREPVHPAAQRLVGEVYRR